MSMIQKAFVAKWILGYSVFLYLIINLFTIKDGHNWGDDFAQYIVHAQNIVQGRPYASNIMLESWAVVPPGFPLFLSPLIYFFGIDFQILKLPNVFYWLGAVLALYPLIKPRVGKEIALSISVLCLFSCRFFMFKQNILSDIPFVFLCISSIYLFRSGRRERWPMACSLILMGMAFLMRYLGIALLLAVILHTWIYRKSWKNILFIVAYMAALYSIQLSFGVTTRQYFEKIHLSFSDWSFLVYKNMTIVFTAIYEFFVPYLGVFWKPLDHFLSFLIFLTAPLMLSGMLIGFILRIKNKTVALWECFTMIYLLALILWPIPDGRYIYPIAAFVLAWGVNVLLGFGRYLSLYLKRPFNFEKGARIILMVVILLNIFFISLFFHFNDDMILQPVTKEMVEWMKVNTQTDEHFMFHKPRIVGLLTGRMGAPLWIMPEHKLQMTERISEFDINYLILTKTKDEYLLDGIDKGKMVIELKWENSVYRIYKVTRI